MNRRKRRYSLQKGRIMNPLKRASTSSASDLEHNRSERKKPKKSHVSHTCDHLEEFKLNEGINIYSKIHTNFVCNLFDRTKEFNKIEVNRCSYCGKFDGLVNACLHCITFGCIKDGHIMQHFKESGHPLVCYLENGSVYCFKCADFVFDRQLDTIAMKNEEISAMKNMLPFNPQFKGSLVAKKLRKLASGSSSTSSSLTIPRPQCVSAQAIWGLRGLINLGQTCFLNAIIQALIHTPMLRDYFLTEKVVCHQMHGSKKEKPCIAPLFSNLFQDFYNGSKTPMSLHDLLYKMWVNATHVSGYDQQDAHEFFMAMILALHDHFHAERGKNNIIDLLFLGNLESSVTCQVCGRKSVTVDPIWDASLNIVTDNPVSNSSSAAEQAKNNAISLNDCLHRYCQKEYLLGSESILCGNCSRNQSATKQLQFQDVPAIFLIHLKRFKHRGQSEKINIPVQFPEHLDMSPYTPEAPELRHLHPGMEDIAIAREAKNSENRYVLYAVVNHVGITIDGGHYYSYIRNSKNDWFLCDDSTITKVKLETVLNSPGYLLFYHRESVYFNTALSVDARKSTTSTTSNKVSK